jgi:hypothetical protein
MTTAGPGLRFDPLQSTDRPCKKIAPSVRDAAAGNQASRRGKSPTSISTIIAKLHGRSMALIASYFYQLSLVLVTTRHYLS